VVGILPVRVESKMEECLAKIKATDSEVRNLEDALKHGEASLKDLREKSTQHLSELIQGAQEHEADELHDLLQRQTVEHEQLNTRLAELQEDRIAAINKRLEASRKTMQDLLKEKEVLLKEEMERDLGPEIEDWLKRVKADLPEDCADLTVFLNSEECFGVVENKNFQNSGKTSITFGAEGGYGYHPDNIHFSLRPEHIMVYSRFEYDDGEFADCYEAVTRAFSDDHYLTPEYESLFIANWDVKSSDRYGRVDWMITLLNGE